MIEFDNNISLELNEDKNERIDYKIEKEEIQKFKEEIIAEWVHLLKDIGSKEVYETAIDKTKSKDMLYALKADLLNDNPDDDPRVKELILKIKHRNK